MGTKDGEGEMGCGEDSGPPTPYRKEGRVSSPDSTCVTYTRFMYHVCEIFLTLRSASRSLPEEQTVTLHSLGLVSTLRW